MSHRDAGYMPPLATSVVDRDAVKLMHDWIKQLQPAPAYSSPQRGNR